MSDPEIVRPEGATRREPAPAGWGKDTLSLFLEAAQHNQLVGFVAMQHGRFRQLAIVDEIFQDFAQGLNEASAPEAPLFLLRAHSYYRAACGLALSGQITEATPLARGCLEMGLYAFHLSRSAEAREIWYARHDSEETKKRMKRELPMRVFFDAVAGVDQQLGDHVRSLYDEAIDLGAHPNPFAVYGGIEVDLSTVSVEANRASGRFTFFEDHPKWHDAGARLVLEAGIACLWIFEHLVPTWFEAKQIAPRLGLLSAELAIEFAGDGRSTG